MSVYHSPAEAREVTLFDLLDTALDKGIVVQGDATISVADVDLVFLGVKLVLASVETMESWRASSRQRGHRVGQEFNSCPTAGAWVGTRDLGPGTGTSTPRPGPALVADPQFPVPNPESPVPSPHPPADIEKVEQGLAKLVLTVVELLRRLLEKQAIRRMEGGSLAEAEIERMGRAFQRLSQKVEELRTVFGLTGQELNLDLGPLGNLM